MFIMRAAATRMGPRWESWKKNNEVLGPGFTQRFQTWSGKVVVVGKDVSGLKCGENRAVVTRGSQTEWKEWLSPLQPRASVKRKFCRSLCLHSACGSN